LLLENAAVKVVARHAGCTPAQAVLAWGMGRGVSVIPKATHVSHIEENFESRACDLTYSSWVVLGGLGRKHAFRFNNPSGNWKVPLYEGLEDS